MHSCHLTIKIYKKRYIWHFINHIGNIYLRKMLNNLQVGFLPVANCHFPSFSIHKQVSILLFSLYKSIGCILSIFNFLSDTNGRIPHCGKTKTNNHTNLVKSKPSPTLCIELSIWTQLGKRTHHTAVLTFPNTPEPLIVLGKHNFP